MIGRRTFNDNMVSASILIFLVALVAWQIVSIFQATEQTSNPDASYSDNL